MPAQIIAVLDTPEEATAAVSALRREGVPGQAITMMSTEPVNGGFEDDQKKSYIGVFAIAGGLIGAASAILLTVITSRRVGLVTGGMPIVTPWAFGIIVFELTALGAILATLARTIIEARLGRPGGSIDYGEALADGMVVLAVDCAEDTQAETAKALLGDKVRTSQESN